MPNTTVYTNNQYYQNIAAAIRRKNGQSTLYKPSEMAPAIDSLVVSGETITLQNKTVNPTTETQTVSKDAGYTGLGIVTVNAIQTETKTATTNGDVTPTNGKFLTKVTVNVPSDINNQNKTIIPAGSQQVVQPDTGYTGLGMVIVRPIPSNYVIPTGTMTINNNGVFDIAQYASVDVDVDTGDTINNQDKTATPTESRQYITPDTGYTGLGQVVVEPIANDYIGSAIDRRTSTDLSVSGATVTAPAGYYSAAASKSVATATQATPEVSINATNGLITASATQTAGYVAAGTKSGTLQLSTVAGTTITPTTTQQTAVAANKYTLGAVNIAAIQTEEKETTVNGEVTPSVGKYLTKVTVNVPVGSTINNQNKTITPTKAQQSITADSGYTGLGTVTVNAIPAQYITTTDADATAANILNNKTAYVNGSKITGTMPNNGATGGTISSQGGTYIIPAGYTSGGTVTASLPVGSTTATNISGAAFEESAGDYGFRTSVQIQPGYYASATTITKDFSSMLPAPDTEGTAAQLLAGYDLYNHNGEVISGTMANNSIGTITLDQTTTSYTIPAGYHDGTGKIQHTTVNIPDPTISVSAAGLITANGSWTRGFTTDNSYSNTKQLTTQAAKTVTPTESEQTAVASGVYTTGTIKVGAISSTYVGSGITQRDSDDLTVSGPTVTAPAGYYAAAASKSVASMTLPTSASSSATSGATNKATIGRSTSVQYINIPVGYNSTASYYTISAVANGSATNRGTASATSATVSTGTNTLTLSKAVSITPTVTAGYISSGTAGNVTVSLTASVSTKGAATITPGTTTQTIAAGTYLTGTQTISGDADLVAGNIKSGVNIFGVNGTYSGLDTSDATATAADIVDGETAYVNGSKITGSMVVNYYYTGSTSPSASLGNNGDIYLQE